VSQRPYRTDGYTNIAEALAELAQPAQVDGEELQRWLESSAEGVTAPVRNGLMLAADVVGAARGAASIDVPDLMKTLWERVLEGVGITTVGRTDGPGMLLVPTITLRHQGLGKGDHILQRYHAGGRAMLRGIPVTVVSRDKAAATCVVEDPSGKLAVGSIIHHNNLSEEWLHLLYQKIDGFEEGLSQAARRLDDVRTLLYWTTAMLDAPLCQGDVKRRATAALEQAKAYYEAAHRQLIDGQSVDAVRRIHEALRRITTAAAELSKSCGDGQTALPGAEPTLVVTPADKAAIERPATMLCAAASVLAGAAMHPASLTGGTLEASPAMMSGSAKPTPPQLRARFAAVSRERASEEGPVYYIFRRKSGRPELLTRDAIIAQTRAEVGDAVYDEAERNPMPGADLFDSCIGTVAMLLEAEFEGRADPRWAESILAGRQQEERERGAGEQKESRP